MPLKYHGLLYYNYAYNCEGLKKTAIACISKVICRCMAFAAVWRLHLFPVEAS